MERVEMIVQGMTCEHCVRRVEKAILSTGKTKDVSVDLATGKVSFLKEEDLDLNEVVKAIELFDYKVIKS
ncbi:MAG: heavy-metal-associated domain-containing protein [Thermodesulfobacterium sp.]|nr:heavy-metal-associated domain-containing protein [Thermodesulfobacterium sp.]